jgi:putative peptide zinc metalloprotease protein
MTDSASERSIALRKRPDLVARACRVGDRRLWRVKDPVSLEYFEFSEQEFAILDMLDGSASLADIQRRFEQAFAPLQLGLNQLQDYLHRLHESGLLLASAPGQGDVLLDRRRDRARREMTARIFNLFAFRLRGVDPQPFLDWLHARLGWIFSAWFLGACGFLVIAAVVLVGVQFDVVRARVPTFGEFVTPANFVWLLVVLSGAKVLHELAHGLVCRHFGGECHELGVMFLVFTPCLYCNVSDSSMLPGRRERILISAAGVIAELVLAAACTFLWWFSRPGLVNSICFNVILVCSVTTVAFNANPLLRYDGYFILADLWHESNLSQKSGAFLSGALRDWCCGVPWIEQSWRSAERPLRLALYGVLSAAYRFSVLATILWFVYAFFKAQHLPSLGRGVAGVGLAGICYVPLAALLSFIHDPIERRRLDGGRVRRLAIVLALVALAAALIPLPRRIVTEALLDAPAAARVYVAVAGQLQESLPAGTRVRRGDVLARLANPSLRREVEKNAGQRDQALRQLERLEASRTDDPAASSQIPAARELLAGLDRRLAQQQRDEERLVLRAPADGVVLPPPARSQREVTRPALKGWERTPLDPINVGCWLETGTLFCQVGDPVGVGPVLMIDQSDIDLVRPGQRVRLRVDQWPASVLTGTIAEVASTNLKTVPRELARAGDLAARRDASGVMRPVEATYTVRVALDEHSQLLLLRGRGNAKVSTAPVPLAARLYRALRRTFHFDL